MNEHDCFGYGGHENVKMEWYRIAKRKQGENGVAGRSEPGKFLDNQ